MSEDKTKVEETTEEETLEENEVDTEQDVDLSEDETEEENNEDSQEDEGIDYKAEYERLTGEVAQKNERISKQDKKILKLKKQKKEEYQDDDEEEEPDIDTVVSQKVEEQMNAFVEDTIDEEISKVSSNEDEQKLIRWYFNNRIVKTGWSKKEIIDYVSDAKALANKGKVISTKKIIEKKDASDKSAGKPNFTGTPPKHNTVKVTAYDKKMAEKYFKGDIKKWLKYKPN